MLPKSFPQQNFIFGKPATMTDDECMSLSVWRGVMNDHSSIISCWQFSKEGLEEIAKTGQIWLSITGNGMSPVSLFTENPFEK